MKKIYFTCLLILIISIPYFKPLAATASPSAIPSDTTAPTPKDRKLQQIENLKERLATKVAELRQTQKRAVFGKVKSKSVSTLAVDTVSKELKIELNEELKIFQLISGKKTELNIDDLDKGDQVVIFGNYDATLDLLKAALIIIQNSLPLRIFGQITQIDRKEFTLTIKTGQDQNYIIDIEKTTKTFDWEKGKGISKSGFSKVNNNDFVQILGIPVVNKENRMSAIRILDLRDLTGTPSTATVASEPTPTTKASPTP